MSDFLNQFLADLDTSDPAAEEADEGELTPSAFLGRLMDAALAGDSRLVEDLRVLALTVPALASALDDFDAGFSAAAEGHADEMS